MAWTNSPLFAKFVLALFRSLARPLKVMPIGAVLALHIAVPIAVLLTSSLATSATAQPVVIKAQTTPSQTVSPPFPPVLKDKVQQDFPAAPQVRSGPLPATVSDAVAAIAPAPSATQRAARQSALCHKLTVVFAAKADLSQR